MKRRRFLTHAAAVTLGAVSFDFDRWAAVTPDDGALPSRLGIADVEQVEQLTGVLRTMDYQQGGGVCRELALGQVDRVRRLLSVPCSEAIQRRLWVAVADLHNLVGWTSFDIGMIDSARAHFTSALELAREAGEPSLVANVLYRAGRVYLHQGCPQDALRLFQLGQIPAKDSGWPLSLAVLCANEAWAYGHLGDSRRAMESLQRAQEEFARAERTGEPGWLSTVSRAGLDGLAGGVHLALARSDAAHAEVAVEHKVKSLAKRGPIMTRSRVLDMIGLAKAYLVAGERSEGLKAGHQALEMATSLRSPRVLDRLTPLAQVAVKYDDNDARDLAVQIRRLQGGNRAL